MGIWESILEFITNTLFNWLVKSASWVLASLLASAFPSKQMQDQQAVESEWNVDDVDHA